MAIAEHLSPRMLARYSHVRVEAKKAALDAIADLKHHQPSQSVSVGVGRTYHTTNDTNSETATEVPAEVLEKNGRPEWTRTIDLFRVKEAL